MLSKKQKLALNYGKNIRITRGAIAILKSVHWYTGGPGPLLPLISQLGVDMEKRVKQYYQYEKRNIKKEEVKDGTSTGTSSTRHI